VGYGAEPNQYSVFTARNNSPTGTNWYLENKIQKHRALETLDQRKYHSSTLDKLFEFCYNSFFLIRNLTKFCQMRSLLELKYQDAQLINLE